MNQFLAIYLIGAGVMLVVSVIGLYLLRGQGSMGDRIAVAIGFAFATVFWPVVAPVAIFIIALQLDIAPGEENDE